MVDFSVARRQQLLVYRDRLARVERGEVWGSDHPGPYTDEERAQEIARIKELIAKLEAEDA